MIPEEGKMKILFFLMAFGLLLAFAVSCSDTIFTLSTECDRTVLIAQDKDTMEHMIDCGITGKCDLSMMELLYKGKVFRVDAGTRVMAANSFTSSDARKVKILDGDHSGKSGWVYERMLIAPDQVNGSPVQLAFCRLSNAR